MNRNSAKSNLIVQWRKYNLISFELQVDQNFTVSGAMVDDEKQYSRARM